MLEFYWIKLNYANITNKKTAKSVRFVFFLMNTLALNRLPRSFSKNGVGDSQPERIVAKRVLCGQAQTIYIQFFVAGLIRWLLEDQVSIFSSLQIRP